MSIHAFGLPIGRRFCKDDGNKRYLRQRLGLPPDQPVVLIVGGANGVGPAEAVASVLSTSNLSICTVVITGRNQRLYQRLIQRADNRCHILQFTSNMADWMHVADVLVGKAGPSTIFEAIHCGLPMS